MPIRAAIPIHWTASPCAKEVRPFFAPHGRIVTGSAAVAKQYRDGAKLFSPGSKNRLEILDSRASGDIGYWVGLQHFQGMMGGKRQNLTLRITEIFRRIHGQYSVIGLSRRCDRMSFFIKQGAILSYI